MTTTTLPPTKSLHVPTARILRAMLAKELRELAPWTALLTLLLALALAYALHDQTQVNLNNRQSYTGDFSILSTPFTLATLFIPAIGALLLGFMQFFPESNPDRYAFLVHRPTPRSTIFLAKNLAAAILYFTATFIPLLLAIIWAKNPHNISLPFSWNMTLPPIANILAASPFYFAGILIARRTDARWFGSRLLPLALPFIAIVFTYPCPKFLYALLITLLALVISHSTARASFSAAGQFNPQSKPAKTALALTLITGILLLLTLAVGLSANFLATNTIDRTTSIDFLADGTPIQATRVDSQVQYQNLAGDPIPELNGSRNAWEKLLQFYELVPVPRPLFATFRDPSHYFTQSFTTGNIKWFRHGPGDYLVGYDNKLKMLVGSIGPDGFAPGAAVPPKTFDHPLATSPLNSSWIQLFASGDTLYQLEDQTNNEFDIKRLATTPDHQPITRFAPLFDRRTPLLTFIAIATNSRISILDPDGSTTSTTHTFDHPFDSDYNISAAYISEKQQFILHYQPVSWESQKSGNPNFALYLNYDGGFEIVTLPAEIYPHSNFDWFESYVLPLVATPALTLISIPFSWLVGETTYPQLPPEALTILAHGLYYAFPTALLAFLLTCRYQLPRPAKILWPLLALAFGPAALLLFFSLRPLPRRTPCPTCQKPRPLASNLCPHCHSPFPPPPRTGTEIFTP